MLVRAQYNIIKEILLNANKIITFVLARLFPGNMRIILKYSNPLEVFSPTQLDELFLDLIFW
jgi:hypothetical protein